jgi:CBS domain-containing protein
VAVQPDDPIELVADLMSWERVRHVAVEDSRGMLVGLVTSRALLRHFATIAKLRASGEAPKSGAELDGVSVADIMRTELLTVTPDTLTVDAIAIMRKQRVGCLPVVQDGHIVAMITEEDFMGIAAEMLDERMGTAIDPPHEHPKGRRRP